MMNSAIKAMQDAVDVVLTSPHPENKVAATLFTDNQSLSRTNDWPPAILQEIGTEARIGDSSGTLHAEVHCILDAEFKTEGASLTITDPCCPNCAKNIAEAGIKTVYIDHKGFQKDFATRRGDEFQDMSLRILAHAGISIYELNRKEQTTKELYRPTEGYIPPEENPIEVRPTPAKISDATLLQAAKLVKVKHARWACALATDIDGMTWTLVASAHPAIGYTHDKMETPEGKYNFILEPANRILMGAARTGLKLSSGHLWCSVLPTPRELVNLVGAGYHTLFIGDMEKAAKQSSLDARKTLEDSGILAFKEMRL